MQSGRTWRDLISHLTVNVSALQIAISFPACPECPEVAPVVVDAPLFAGVGGARREAAPVPDVVAEKVGVKVGAAREARVDDASDASQWRAAHAEYLRVEAGAEAPIVSPIPIDDRSVTGLNLNTKRNLTKTSLLS